MALVVKYQPANAGDIRDMGLIHRRKHSNSLQHSSLGSLRDREPGRPQSMGSQRAGHD